MKTSLTEVNFPVKSFPAPFFVCLLILVFGTHARSVNTRAIRIKLDLASTVDLMKGRSSSITVNRIIFSVTPAQPPRRPLMSVRPRPWSNPLDEDYIHYSDVSNVGESRRQAVATRASIYIGIVSFAAVIVVLCLIASSMAVGSKCCPKLAHFCGCEEDPAIANTSAAAAAAAAAAAETRSDSATLPSNIVIDTPPSYDEVVGRPESRISPITTSAVAIDDLSYVTGDDVPLSSVSGRISVAGHRNPTNAVSRVLREFRTSNTSIPSPPSYLQAIKNWAARGIVANKTLILTPPPTYNSLASTKNTTGKPDEAEVSRMTDSDSSHSDNSLSRVTTGVNLSVSPADDNVSSPRMSGVGLSSSCGVVESRTRISINGVIVYPVAGDVSNSSNRSTSPARNS